MRLPEGVTLRIKPYKIAKFSTARVSNIKQGRCINMVRSCKTKFDKCKCGHEFEKKEKVCPKCKTERRCGYKFKKGEMKCAVCGADRTQCKNQAAPGSKKCKEHGAKVNLIDVSNKDIENYDPTKTDLKSMAVGAVMDLDYEMQRYQGMMSALEGMVNKSDPKELSNFIGKMNKYWKDVLKTYYEILDRKKIIERIPPDLDKQIKEIISEVDNKSTIACIDAFITAMTKVGIADDLARKVIEALPSEMQRMYNNKVVDVPVVEVVNNGQS